MIDRIGNMQYDNMLSGGGVETPDPFEQAQAYDFLAYMQRMKLEREADEIDCWFVPAEPKKGR